MRRVYTYIVVGEVTALEHEFRDNTVEGAASVAVALLASAKSPEVLSSLGHNIGIKLEADAALRLCEVFLLAVPIGKKKTRQ